MCISVPSLPSPASLYPSLPSFLCLYTVLCCSLSLPICRFSSLSVSFPFTCGPEWKHWGNNAACCCCCGCCQGTGGVHLVPYGRERVHYAVVAPTTTTVPRPQQQLWKCIRTRGYCTLFDLDTVTKLVLLAISLVFPLTLTMCSWCLESCVGFFFHPPCASICIPPCFWGNLSPCMECKKWEIKAEELGLCSIWRRGCVRQRLTVVLGDEDGPAGCWELRTRLSLLV